MNIQDRIRLGVVISLIIVLAISGSIIYTTLEKQDLKYQEDLAAEVVRGGYELSQLSNEYFLFGESASLLRWEDRYVSLQPVLNELQPTNEQEERSISLIMENNSGIGRVLEDVIQAQESDTGRTDFSASGSPVLLRENQEQTQGLILEAWNLRHLYHNDLNIILFWIDLFIVVLIFAMLAIITANYLLLSRRLVRSIREVNAGSEAFSHGDLAYRIPITGDDEIGGIARRLNTMAEQIQSVTASRDELNREIAERREAEEALRESESRFQMMSDWTYDWEYWITQNRDVVYCSPSIERITGYSAKEFMADRNLIERMIHPDDCALWEEHLPRHEEDEPDAQPTEIELRIITKNGTTRWIAHICRAIFAADGTWAGRRISNRDITKRKNAEEAQRASEVQYRRLFEAAQDGILILDAQTGQIIDMNPFLINLLGFPHEDFFGKNIWEIGVLNDIVSSSVNFEELKQKKYIRYEDLPLTTADGRQIIVEFASNVYMVDNKEIIQCNIRDSTERNKAEEALRVVNKKLNLLSGITRHDIINQVMGAEMILEMIELENTVPQDSRIKEDLETIGDALETIERQIVFTRDYQDLGIKSANWQNVGVIVEKTAADAGSELQVINEVGHLSVYADPLFEKVIYNLFDNAIRHGEKITLIRFFSEETPEGLKLICEDDGVGVPVDVKEKIFNRQYFKHTGLGLFLSREILSITGMTIAETGVPGVGARFEISVPAGGYRIQ